MRAKHEEDPSIHPNMIYSYGWMMEQLIDQK